MDPLSIAASVVAVLQLSTKVLSFLNDVKDAPKERTQCAFELSNLNTLLLQIRLRLESGTTETKWLTAIKALAVEDGDLEHFKQALSSLQSGLQYDRSRKFGEDLRWKFKKDDVEKILNRIERLKSSISIALHLDSIEISQAVKEDTEDIKRQVAPILKYGDDVENRSLLEWLSPVDSTSTLSRFTEDRAANTGEWFLQEPTFVKWLKTEKGTLLCPGIPGAGKSMMAAIAIDHLMRTTRDLSHGLAFVFYDYNMPENHSESAVLAALLKQLVQGQVPTIEHVQQLRAKTMNRRPSADQIFETLGSVVACYTTIHIVSDALDECKEYDRGRFLGRIRDLQTIADIRFMATTRPIHNILDHFQDALLLEIEAKQADLGAFVEEQMPRLARCIQRDDELRTYAKSTIVSSAGAMFLVARLDLEALQGNLTLKKVKLILSQMSKGSTPLERLKNVYQSSILRIESQSSDDCGLAKKVISWITYAMRTLTAEELCCALAVEEGETKIDPDNLHDPQDLVSVCAGLLVLEKDTFGELVIRFVHFTTRDFFIEHLHAWFPEDRMTLATTCLTYLSFEDFKNGKCSTYAEWVDRCRRHVLFRYAADFWVDHARPVENDIVGLAKDLVMHDGLRSSTQQGRTLSPDLGRSFSRCSFVEPKDTALHFAARLGLSRVAQAILLAHTDNVTLAVDAHSCEQKTALTIAASYGHTDMVQLLLNHDADINAQHMEGRFPGVTALQVAAGSGFEEIVAKLLEKGADVNARGCCRYHGITYPLLAAASEGHTSVVEQLLVRGANVNARDEYGWTAIHLAALDDAEHVIRVLVEYGADIEALDQHGRTAIEIASMRNCLPIVKLLLGYKAKMRRALYHAANERSTQVVELLITESLEDSHNLALGIPSHFEHVPEENLSLDISLNQALHQASVRGVWTCIKAILRTGIDINALDGDQRTALQLASFHGCDDVVEQLLNSGADINAGTSSWHALKMASRLGHSGVVRTILSKCDASTLYHMFHPALLEAAVDGCENVLEVLLEYFRDNLGVQSLGPGYEQALLCACRSGYERTVKLLLEMHNPASSTFEKALQTAAETSQDMMVKSWLDRCSSPELWTEAFRACSITDPGGPSLELLLRVRDERGADIRRKLFSSARAILGRIERESRLMPRSDLLRQVLPYAAVYRFGPGPYEGPWYPGEYVAKITERELEGYFLRDYEAMLNLLSSEHPLPPIFDGAIHNASLNQKNILRILLSKYDYTAETLETAINKGICEGNMVVVETLLEGYPNPKVSTLDGWLRLASVRHNWQMMHVLLHQNEFAFSPDVLHDAIESLKAGDAIFGPLTKEMTEKRDNVTRTLFSRGSSTTAA